MNAVTTDASQLGVLGAIAGVGDVDASQLGVVAAVNYPSDSVEASQASVLAAAAFGLEVEASQFGVLAAVKGRISDPKVRAWTFTLDGHDYYVLRLGNKETLVYDTNTQEWYVWGTKEANLWRAYSGSNWLGGYKFSSVYGSNILVGDDGNGSVYFLDPLKVDDDSPVEGAEANTFERVIMSQYSFNSGYNVVPCYGIQVLGSIGQTEDTRSASLYISDDRGITYTSVGSLDVVEDEYDTRVTWKSLGSMRAPGRLFKLKDTGAFTRVDAFEMDMGGE